MNKARRKQLDEIYSKLEEIKTDLEGVSAEEEEYRDNMPENLQNSERYQVADAAVSELECAVDSLDEALSSIETAQE